MTSIPYFFIFMFAMAALLQQSPALQTVEQRLGPFSIAGQSFTVVLYNKRLVDPSGVPVSETLSALEIRDQLGDIQYGRTFPYEIREGKFQQTLSASVKLVSRKADSGLLVQYRTKPTPQGSGESSQIFRLKDGKLVTGSQ